MLEFTDVGDSDGYLFSSRNVPEASHEDIGGETLLEQTSGLTTFYSGVVFFLRFVFLFD